MASLMGMRKSISVSWRPIGVVEIRSHLQFFARLLPTDSPRWSSSSDERSEYWVKSLFPDSELELRVWISQAEARCALRNKRRRDIDRMPRGTFHATHHGDLAGTQT